MSVFTLPNMIYELLAQQIIDDYGITEGRCLDIGTGTGGLGLEIAKRTKLHTYLLDIDNAGLLIAEKNSRETGLSGRASIINAPAERLPFLDNFFDLVVSRGSFFLWQDKLGGLSEVYRVLKRAGVAYIGGGTSRYMSPEQAEEYSRWARPRHQQINPDWENLQSPQAIKDILYVAGIKSYTLIDSNGTWIEIRK
jgi:ubiquinone/menaquinone biosynthesis C-methylase UbiE